MTKTLATRQRLRRAALLVSLLLFPVILNYLSPYVIIDGASQGIINGSLVMFGLFFLSSLFLGRLWCSWLCPAGGLGEMCFMVNDQPVKNLKRADRDLKETVWRTYKNLALLGKDNTMRVVDLGLVYAVEVTEVKGKSNVRIVSSNLRINF